MISIQAALQQARSQITSETSDLDAQLIVSKVLNKERSFCFTYPESLLTEDQLARFNQLLNLRKQGVPMAYLLEEKEFWSRDFIVTQDCLIPRPETELIIEWCLQNLPEDHAVAVADLGTGTGAIAVTLAAERPQWQIGASDISDKAMFVVKQNAIRYNVTDQMTFHYGNWFEPFADFRFDAIIANPPYIADRDPALSHEPEQALYSENEGLADLQTIIQGAPEHLKPQGYLILEHGCEQRGAVVDLLEKSGYIAIQTFDDLAGLNRMVVAQHAGNSTSN